MRIITGKARGKRLQTPEGLHTRPTTERVKESVFSIVQWDIEGRKALDLFGGSGQLGLEEICRIDILSEGGIIICESGENDALLPVPAPYRVLRRYHYGHSAVVTITKGGEEA